MTRLRTALTGPTRAALCLLIAGLGALVISGILAMHVIASPRAHDMTSPGGATPMAMTAELPDDAVEVTALSGTAAMSGSAADEIPGHNAMAMACALALLAVGILLIASPLRRSAWSGGSIAPSVIPPLFRGSRPPPDLNVLGICRT